ncbi:MAG: UbiA family prenyltransferase [candidate division WOR-3 bacterium]|nr:MAG: UbiA family prenyltransferase [candidate division WOR-3 bacterium]
MSKASYPFFSVGFLRSYVITMRPYLLFISGAAGLVGLAFIEEPAIRVILAFMPLFLSYGLGQALTDCFQTDTDAISAPYRPLIQGVISRRQVLTVSLAGLTAGALILGYLNPVILILGFLAVIGLLTYTPFKRTWWGGPPWNSWIVALLPIMGRLVDRDHGGHMFNLRDPYSLAFFFAVVAIFFGYANFVVMGYFKDIAADRKTGYQTFPVVFGWVPAAIYSDLTALAAAVFTGYAVILIGGLNVWVVLVFGTAFLINLYAQVTIHLTRDERKTHRPIENVVRAFILYCMAILLALKINWLIFIAVFYLLFELTLRLRPEKHQV